MTNELRSLANICKAHLLDTKWLLVPSHRVGHQWVEALVRNGQPIVNLRPVSLLRLALDLVGPELTASGLTLVGGELGPLIVESSWRQLKPDGYLGRLEPSAELSAAVYDSLVTLRLADDKLDVLRVGDLENNAKAADIRQLQLAYRDFLASHALVDASDVLRRAIAHLQSESCAFEPNTWILVPDDVDLVGLERRFLEAWPADRRLLIEHPGKSRPERTSTPDIAQLSQIKAATPTVQLRHDDSVRFFRAVGETNEVREVLRRCLAEQVSLDEVEILHTDTATYSELIYATAKRLFSEGDRADGLPVTFAEGIPASVSRPGRALAAWLQWVADGYPQRVLVEMISEGLLNFADDDDLSFQHLARLLRPVAIGLGAAGYLPKLDEQIEALKKKAPESAADPDEQARSLAARARDLKGFVALRKLIAKLLKLSRAIEQPTGITLLESAVKFLQDMARSISELDRYAAERLVEQLQDRQLWLKQFDFALDLGKWLAVLPSQTRVLGSGPRPGHLHVAHVGSGGQSGRTQTFVVGLDDRRFPGASLQNPILLDRELAGLSTELRTSAGQLRKRIENLALSLSRLRGRVTLSWPCRDLADDRETFPCSFVLSAYRLISGKQDTDLASLNSAVGPPVSFAPTSAVKALDETERWLWRLSEEDVLGTDQMPLVDARFPHLARGSHARRERLTGFGPYNGFVPSAGKELDPFAPDGPVLSASALETAGRCPRAFFFRNGLKLYLPDELEIDPDQWLDAAQFGLLLHEVFRRYLAELTKAGKLPVYERDHQRLAAILQDCVAEWRMNTPPPNENAYRTQYWRLVRTAKLFLQAEEEFCRNSRPRYFEVALGLESVGEGSLLDNKEAILVNLGGDRSIRVRGQIDRVDQTGDQRFVVWDYKLGSGYGYDQNDPFREGRRVQSLLYLRMIETALRNKHAAQATVDGFGYFFPGVRTFNLRIQWTAAALSGGTSILNRVCSQIREGAFPATNKADDCRYCDYQSICGDGSLLAIQSQNLLDRDDLVPLRHFRELRCRD